MLHLNREAATRFHWFCAMTKVKYPHYVPIGALLKNFAAGQNTIWLYRRGERPALQALRNVGKQRFLYDQATEEIFQDLDGRAVAAISMLNNLQGSEPLDAETWGVLLSFIGFQAMRTPSAKERLKEVDRQLLREMAVPSAATEVAGTIVVDKKWWLGRMGRLGSLIASALAEKTMTIFRNETDRPFVLPDDPVLLVRNGGYPATERQGFFQAHILFPLSSRAVLFLKVPEILWPRDEEKHGTIEVREATIAMVDLINNALMSHAARFLFARENCPLIAQRLNRSRPNTSAEPVLMEGLSDPPAPFAPLL